MVEAEGGSGGQGGNADNSEVYAGGNVIQEFTIADAQALQAPTDKILCTLADNTFIRFGEYSVCDYDTRTELLHVTSEQNKQQDDFAREQEQDGTLTMDMRILKHEFPRAFFQLRNLELNLEFTNVNGDQPLQQLTLIEKHFFRGQILSQFEFNFPFCVPKSTNQWQYVYELPELSEEQQQEMIDAPFETQSDSFFFAEGRLIVHNKAAYKYF